MNTVGIVVFLFASLGVAITLGILLLGLLMKNLREILSKVVIALAVMGTICIGDLWICGALPQINQGHPRDVVYVAENDTVSDPVSSMSNGVVDDGKNDTSHGTISNTSNHSSEYAQNDPSNDFGKDYGHADRMSNAAERVTSNQVSLYAGDSNYENGLEPTYYEVAEGISDFSALTAGAGADDEKFRELQVHFIDVGQGDCTLITCGDQSMLIDAGDNSKGTAVQLYLQKRGIDSLDYMIGTHPDADHIGGMDVVVTKFDCRQIMLPNVSNDTATYRDVIDAMNYKGYQNTLPVVGSTYTLGDAIFTIVAPNAAYDDTNNHSIGIRLVHGENSFLFIGDAEEEAEQDMLYNGLELSADVLKVAHHGSRSSSSWEFIHAVNPTYAVISCGINNAYGHPSAETLNTLRSAGIKVYRTDEQGSIVATSDGYGISFNCAPSESWQAGEIRNVVQNVEQPYVNQKVTSDEIQESSEGTVHDGESYVESEPVVGYVLNKRSKKFHRTDCFHVDSMSEKNKVYSNQTIDEIVAAGYEKCQDCLGQS